MIKRSDYNFSNNVKLGGYNYITFKKADSLAKKLNFVSDFLEEKNYKVSHENLNYLDKIIKFCESSSVKVYFVRSPLHNKYQGIKNENVFKSILKNKYSHIEFLDFKDFPIPNDGFGDLEHLNYIGARKFSLFFDKLLNSELFLTKANKQNQIDNLIEKINRQKDWENEIYNAKVINNKSLTITNTLSRAKKYKIEKELIEKLKIKEGYFDQNEKFWSIMLETDEGINDEFFKDKSLGVHLKINKKDYDKRPLWLEKRDSDILTFKVQPEIIKYEKRTYFIFNLKKSCSIETFDYFKIFLQNKDKYNGVLGNSIIVNDINF